MWKQVMAWIVAAGMANLGLTGRVWAEGEMGQDSRSLLETYVSSPGLDAATETVMQARIVEDAVTAQISAGVGNQAGAAAMAAPMPPQDPIPPTPPPQPEGDDGDPVPPAPSGPPTSNPPLQPHPWTWTVQNPPPPPAGTVRQEDEPDDRDGMRGVTRFYFDADGNMIDTVWLEDPNPPVPALFPQPHPWTVEDPPPPPAGTVREEDARHDRGDKRGVIRFYYDADGQVIGAIWLFHPDLPPLPPPLPPLFPPFNIRDWTFRSDDPSDWGYPESTG